MTNLENMLHNWNKTDEYLKDKIEKNKTEVGLVKTAVSGKVDIELFNALWKAIDTPILIIDQPVDQICNVGETVSLTVAAYGNNLAYQWYRYSESSGNWIKSTSTGNDTPRFEFAMSSSMNGWRYKCVITDENNKTADTNEVVLSLPVTQSLDED